MDILEEWRPVFQQVVYRAFCDAIGFTNLPHDKEEHKRTVNQARAWFIENSVEYQTMCELSSMDSESTRETAMRLIYARSSGDHSKIEPFWREVFQRRRIPNLTNIATALANLKKAV